jgi:asparagine synthase (glutamine-hydrolysing)
VCGICGKFIFSSSNPSAENQSDYVELERMCTIIHHRGPDSQGIKLFDNGAFGMRRLRIIDLMSGDQPIANEDDTIWIVFNGEIYNYRELRNELLRLGHAFRTESDTEVLLHLYEEYGDAFVKRCNGMFAFCIHDTRRQRLYLARDRLGQKPLFYFYDGIRFLFASEIKSLLVGSHMPRKVNQSAILDYLTFGFVPNPSTAFEGIYQVEPAHYMIVDATGLGKHGYWHLDSRSPIERSLADAQAEYLDLLRSCIRDRLISDVPVGLLLSGGIDSCSILSMMAEVDDTLPAFTIRFRDARKDEGAVAKEMARHAGAIHKEFYVEVEDMRSILPKLAWHYEQPFNDPSAVPTYYVSRMAREHVTVVLTGDGGDELFGGYWYNLMNVWLHKTRFIPAPARQFGFWVGEKLAAILGHQNYADWFSKLNHAARLPAFEAAISWLAYRPDDILSTHLQKNDYDPFDRPRALWDDDDGFEHLNHILSSCYRRFKLVDGYLVKIDRASMANSLEARSPFLDHRLVEFAATLPDRWKVHGLTTKWFARRAVQSRLPRKIVGKRKTGFGVPLRKWMLGDLGGFAWSLVLSEQALSRNYFDPAALSDLHEKSVGGRADVSHVLYHLVMLELWHRLFVDEFAETPDRLELGLGTARDIGY